MNTSMLHTNTHTRSHTCRYLHVTTAFNTIHLSFTCRGSTDTPVTATLRFLMVLQGRPGFPCYKLLRKTQKNRPDNEDWILTWPTAYRGEAMKVPWSLYWTIFLNNHKEMSILVLNWQTYQSFEVYILTLVIQHRELRWMDARQVNWHPPLGLPRTVISSLSFPFCITDVPQLAQQIYCRFAENSVIVSVHHEDENSCYITHCIPLLM